MAREHVVTELVRQGKTPFEIAIEIGVSLQSVEQYLHRAIGFKLLRKSDIYFSVSPERRESLGKWFNVGYLITDMFEDIRSIEIEVHRRIRDALVRHFGDGEDGWWRQGIPEKVRVKCQERRETDPDDPCEPYCYSDLLDLEDIIRKQWILLNCLFPDYSCDRKQFSNDLKRLNRIRNKVMHPARGMVPCEEEFDFVRQLQQSLCHEGT